ncbi:TfoX/Sxy family DNA transformation protein [Vibrio sp. JC009]|uniref:TfoX/Sxy family DNA transformation protein n=1 Tax=Vibrio sp. JC009 TaxID=2912314 RepID=UPI0023AE7229|nr:TfoX/Sxy family DNA transformation protein [Vibrio sp. JC009]WED20757.1 TfoX/Sxy family DNA transformation protein [Vibrio sp. JC009]
MDKPVLKDSLRLFEHFGKVKSRSMFGGFGIFVDETMFALVVNDALHIRSNDSTIEEFKAAGYKPYVYKKRGFPVVTKYFALPQDFWDDTNDILKIAEHALNLAKEEKAHQAEEKPTRLKDLPNLRLGTERMLKKAGINSVAELRQAGSVGAFKAIKQTNSTVSLELLWALEGALKGKHWSVITKERRDELMSKLD